MAIKIIAKPNIASDRSIKSGKIGRPASGKIVVTIRLSPEVVAKFKATGKGWQSRIDEVLKKAVP